MVSIIFLVLARTFFHCYLQVNKICFSWIIFFIFNNIFLVVAVV